MSMPQMKKNKSVSRIDEAIQSKQNEIAQNKSTLAFLQENLKSQSNSKKDSDQKGANPDKDNKPEQNKQQPTNVQEPQKDIVQ